VDELGLKARSSVVVEPGIAVLVAGEQTAGRSGLVETVKERDAEPPRHLHHLEDETVYVIEGSLNVWVAGEWVEAPAGTAVFLPRGVEHACVAATEKARMLSFFTPAGFERFYGDMAATGPLDVERLVTTAARYGCEIVGPTPERPQVRESPLETMTPTTNRHAGTR
jgi:quercetin dioxygenase-like cupin family protein